jgi:hypothetical protein
MNCRSNGVAGRPAAKVASCHRYERLSNGARPFRGTLEPGIDFSRTELISWKASDIIASSIGV